MKTSELVCLVYEIQQLCSWLYVRSNIKLPWLNSTHTQNSILGSKFRIDQTAPHSVCPGDISKAGYHCEGRHRTGNMSDEYVSEKVNFTQNISCLCPDLMSENTNLIHSISHEYLWVFDKYKSSCKKENAFDPFICTIPLAMISGGIDDFIAEAANMK